jgi:uncharacterized membrane protein YidH (DUF202 family)
MDIDPPKTFIERRGHVNKRLQLLQGLTVSAWASFAIALLMFHYARPELNYGILRHAGLTVRETWLSDYKLYFVILLVVCCLLSLASVLINRQIMRRKTDRFHYNVVLLAVICLSSLVALIVG